MTREEAIKRLKEAKGTIQPFLYVDEAIDYATKTLEQESCEDCVSRQAVLTEIDKYLCGVPYEKGIDKVIKDLPSVTPKPKADTWSIKEVANTLEKHGLMVESEVEHAEALRSPEESSSDDA